MTSQRLKIPDTPPPANGLSRTRPGSSDVNFDEAGGGLIQNSLSLPAGINGPARLSTIYLPSQWASCGEVYVVNGQQNTEPGWSYKGSVHCQGKIADFRQKLQNPLPLVGLDTCYNKKLVRNWGWKSTLLHAAESATSCRSSGFLSAALSFFSRSKSNVAPEAITAAENVLGILESNKTVFTKHRNSYLENQDRTRKSNNDSV